MKEYDYWNLFWLSGMPEAWMLSRPTEGYLFPSEPAAKDLPDRRENLPEEVRQLRQERPEEIG